MFDIYDVAAITLAVALAAYWWHVSGQHARALEVTRRHCDLAGLQLLDETLAFRTWRIERGGNGLPRLHRHYDFDFCNDGEKRYHGEIVISGLSVIRIVLETDQVEVTQF